MLLPFSRHSLRQMMSVSIPGTLTVFAGIVVLLAGLLYGGALVYIETRSPPATDPAPAGVSNVYTIVLVILLSGSALIVLGVQLVEYSR